jgi:hypothetical protein
MINSELPAQPGHDEQVDRIVEDGPRGALALAGIATVLVVAMWLAFYLLVFLPRGALQ